MDRPLHIDPEYAQIGGGSYHLDKHGTQAVREAIVENQDEYLKKQNYFKEE